MAKLPNEAMDDMMRYKKVMSSSPPEWSGRQPLPSFLASPRPPTLSRVARLDLAARQCPQLLVTYSSARLDLATRQSQHLQFEARSSKVQLYQVRFSN